MHGAAGFCDPAFAANRDEPVHRWTGWVAGFSKHFAADAITRFAGDADTILDPFAGAGTTLVEADLAGCRTAGFEINPYARLVSAVRLKPCTTETDMPRRDAAASGVSCKLSVRGHLVLTCFDNLLNILRSC